MKPENEDDIEPMEVIPFFVVGEGDVVTHTGSCQRLNLAENARYGAVHEGQAPMGAYKFIGGEFVPYVAVVAYDQARQQAYPSVTDQLDMLWHAMDAGEMPRAEPFYSSIAAIKAAHPKPA